MTEFNVALLRKGVEWAESEARKPRAESEWCQSYFAVAGSRISRTCGTAYCIAGWAIVTAGNGRHDLTEHMIDDDGNAYAAQKLFGIDSDDAWGAGLEHGLFTSCNSIEDIRYFAEEIARKYGEEL